MGADANQASELGTSKNGVAAPADVKQVHLCAWLACFATAQAAFSEPILGDHDKPIIGVPQLQLRAGGAARAGL